MSPFMSYFLIGQDICRYFTDIEVIRTSELNPDNRTLNADSKFVIPRKRVNKTVNRNAS